MVKWTGEYRKKYMKRRRETLKGRAKELINAARGRARNKKLSFNLDLEWAEDILLKGKCQLTNIEFIFKIPNGSSSPQAPSIDRINAKDGYTKKNSQIVLWCVNTAKAEMSMKEYKEITERILEGLNETTS